MPEERKFKPGDLVRLKSGGPDMTVDYWDSTLLCYRCSWFDGTKRMHDSFKEPTLEAVNK
jgi:uncharacterized protein YodC (DUF2158 family)